MSDPVSRTILLLDIERYSDRDDVEQAYLRRMLYDITDRTLESAGIDETRRLRADRGDSVMELIDASAPVTALLRALLTEVPVRLKAVNRMASRSAQIRLRGVVATGYVAVDLHDGWVGSDLNHACRLLDADVLRAALRERTADFALCVSDGLYAGVVRHDHPGIPADDFHRVTVASKNGPLEAWLHGPVPEGAAGKNHGDAGKGEGEAQGGSGDRPAPGAPGPEAPAPDASTPRTPTTQAPAAASASDNSSAQPTTSDTRAARAPAADNPATQPTTSDTRPAQAPAADNSATQPTTSDTRAAQAPAADSPTAQPPAADSPTTQPPAADNPATQPPAEDAPAARPPASGAPASDAPAPGAPEERVPPQGGSPENSPAPDGTRGAPAPGVVFHFNGGSPSFGGSLVGHDQHGVSGGQVTGDVHLGGQERRDGA
ncbi:hypothetical protein [Streptomyces sp. cg40]|uniref:hypothetical protein n=1 Tax=Streptomyces sp. cg40 TaxID=3419764 RepID=UPI003D07874D